MVVIAILQTANIIVNGNRFGRVEPQAEPHYQVRYTRTILHCHVL